MKNNSVIRKGREGIQSGGGGRFVKIDPNTAVDIVVLCTIDDFVSFDQHTIWRDEGNSPTFVCIGSDNNCPGCAMEDKPAQKTYIPVYDLGAKAAKILAAGTNVARAIADCAEETEIKGRAFRIKRRGQGKSTRYTVIMLNKKANVSKISLPDVESAIPSTNRKAIVKLLLDAGFNEDDFETEGAASEVAHKSRHVVEATEADDDLADDDA